MIAAVLDTNTLASGAVARTGTLSLIIDDWRAGVFTAESTQLVVEVHGIATHPEDDLIVSTAVSARADYLVTGDRKLPEIVTFAGVRVLSPRGFVEILNIEKDRGGAEPP